MLSISYWQFYRLIVNSFLGFLHPREMSEMFIGIRQYSIDVLTLHAYTSSIFFPEWIHACDMQAFSLHPPSCSIHSDNLLHPQPSVR